MNQQIGLTEFFAMEASGYLERLDALVSQANAPSGDELVRLARQLRGSALMAKQEPIAAAAAAFEAFARSVQAGQRPWDEANRQLATRAVDDFKILVRAVANWTESEAAKARGLVAELDPHGGARASAQQQAPAGAGLDTGTRAFIGREGAAVASALDQAAKSLQQNPAARDPLQRVLQVAQPLRGLAMLAEVPPMPELLEGIERGIGEVFRRGQDQGNAALMFNAAARALAHAAQEVATQGAATPDSEPMQEFARRLGELLGLDDDIVPIESLYHDDAGPHIVQQGTVTARPGALGRLELVSHGEHLRLAADQLERATSNTQRELRAQALAGTFRALAAASGGQLQSAVARFATAAREAVTRGAPAHQTQEFAARLREAGEALGAAPEGDDPQLAQRVATVTEQVRALAGGALAAAQPAGGALHRPAAPSVATAQPAPQPLPVVPIESLAPDIPAAPVTAAPAATAAPAPAAAAPAGLDETADLVGSWIRYERYRESLGLDAPSLDDLLAGPPADPRRAAAAPTAAAPVGAELPEVPIAQLLYSGTAALERAMLLRDKVRAAVASGAPGADVTPLIEEVFDLVELGLRTP